MIIDCAAYVEGRRKTGRLGFDDIAEWCAVPGAFVWLGLRMPNAEELALAGSILRIDTDELDEALSPHARPVLSTRADHVWLVLRTVRWNPALRCLMLGELSVLAGSNYVLTIRHGQASPLTGLRQRLESEGDGLDSPLCVLAAIITLVIENYRPALDAFEHEAIEVEREVFSADRPRQPKRLLELKREVRDLYLAIEPLHEPLARLGHRLGEAASTEVRGEIEEAGEILATMVQRIHSLSDLLDAAIDANLAQIGLQQNEDMRRISAWVAMAAVPTLLAGIYGMNFNTMPELQWAFGYPFALALMGCITLLLYRGFKRSGWL